MIKLKKGGFMKKNDNHVLKTLIEEKFSYKVNQIEYLGGGVDSNAYLVNKDYVFKFGISENSKADYSAQKVFSDFYKENPINNIETPKIEYYFSDEKIRIIGYRLLEGKFINRKIYDDMNYNQQESFCKDVALFLRKLHSYNVTSINLEQMDMRKKMLGEIELIKKNIFNILNENEKKYIYKFEKRLIESNVFEGRKCICHIDFNPDHILIDDNNNFKGVIDWGGAVITCEYAEFPYLLSNGEDELGRDIGLKILNYYGDIDIDKSIEYCNIHRMEYPITELVYGIENNKIESIEFGRKIIANKCKNDDDIINIMK